MDRNRLQKLKALAEELLAAVDTDPDDVDSDEITRLGQVQPMPIERARPFYARILKTLRPDRSDEDIAAEVEEILSAQAWRT